MCEDNYQSPTKFFYSVSVGMKKKDQESHQVQLNKIKNFHPDTHTLAPNETNKNERRERERVW